MAAIYKHSKCCPNVQMWNICVAFWLGWPVVEDKLLGGFALAFRRKKEAKGTERQKTSEGGGKVKPRALHPLQLHPTPTSPWGVVLAYFWPFCIKWTVTFSILISILNSEFTNDLELALFAFSL